MPIEQGNKIKVHYTGKLADGTVFDSSRAREPLEFVLGQGMLIPGFENALLGHVAGDMVSVKIPPVEAYGDFDPELLFTVQREQIPAHIPLEVGTALELSHDQGEMDVVISEVAPGGEVTLDANHPLAGQELHFEIEILEVMAPGD